MLRSIENQTLDPSFCLQQQTPGKGAIPGGARAPTGPFSSPLRVPVIHGAGKLSAQRQSPTAVVGQGRALLGDRAPPRWWGPGPLGG